MSVPRIIDLVEDLVASGRRVSLSELQALHAAYQESERQRLLVAVGNSALNCKNRLTRSEMRQIQDNGYAGFALMKALQDCVRQCDNRITLDELNKLCDESSEGMVTIEA